MMHVDDFRKHELAYGQGDDWGPGDYLVVVDKNPEVDEVLAGSYDIHVERTEEHPDGISIMVWQPYPEEPIIGFDNINSTLQEHINRHLNPFS